MTYREGVYVWDKVRGEVGRVMDERLGQVYLRPVGGGREWPAKPRDLRLATKVEKAAAGVKESAAV